MPKTVEIELIEAHDMSDLLLLNAQTIADGKLLQTDGVVFLQARADGKELAVKEGKFVEIEVPSENRDDHMKAFVGGFDADGSMNWEEGNTMSRESAEAVSDIVRYQFF